MNVVGLITEYNPFHNGHAYHIQRAKELTNADYCVVVMSGNYVQRGTPAIIDKYSRTKMALKNGADIVIELPVLYATSSAEGFAAGSVRILHDLGIVTDLCFGSECGDIHLLNHIAHVLCEESTAFKNCLKENLRQGLSFPVARKKAILTTDTTHAIDPDELSTVLESSNNILGIEYLKALHRLSSHIRPSTILREGSNYNDKALNPLFSSASAIRNSLSNLGNASMIDAHMPQTAYSILEQSVNKIAPICEDDFSDVLQYQLLTSSIETLTSYLDMNIDLANRLHDLVYQAHTFTEYSELLKSKHHTMTRMNRALLHTILQITKEDYTNMDPQGHSSYARLLGFRKEASSLLKAARIHGTIPIITKVADASKQLGKNELRSFQKDIFATHLYNQIIASKYGTILPNEFKQGPLRIE